MWLILQAVSLFFCGKCVFFVLVVGVQLNLPILQAKCSALHPVSEKGDTSLVQLLLEYRANADFKNQVSKHKLGGSSTLFQESFFWQHS